MVLAHRAKEADRGPSLLAGMLKSNQVTDRSHSQGAPGTRST